MALPVRMFYLLRQQKFLPSRRRLEQRVIGRVNMTARVILITSTTTDTDGPTELLRLAQLSLRTFSLADSRVRMK